ncbi:Hsp70 family protein [Acinetobacter baumannii]
MTRTTYYLLDVTPLTLGIETMGGVLAQSLRKTRRFLRNHQCSSTAA